MRLVLCDDQRILVESLAVALRARGFDVLAAAATPEECLRAVAKDRPDVCLLDLYLPRWEDGLETAQTIQASYPGTQVLILSGVTDPLVLSAAINLGVAGIIRKDQTVDKIAGALLQAVEDGSVFQADVVRDVARQLAPQPPKEPWDYLTDTGTGGTPPDRRRREHRDRWRGPCRSRPAPSAPMRRTCSPSWAPIRGLRHRPSRSGPGWWTKPHMSPLSSINRRSPRTSSGAITRAKWPPY